MISKLSMKNVSKSFSQGLSTVEVLKNVSLDFLQGSSYALMGASGSGKSTCIFLLAGLDVTTSGNILFNERNVFLANKKETSIFLKKEIGIVFQKSYLVAELTVLENIMLKEILSGEVTKKSYQRAEFLLDYVGLADKKEAYPSMLSGGQQQRIALLRAIFVVPKFLLLDEPTGNLDEKSSVEIINLLKHYQKEYKIGIIMSTHNKIIANQMDNLLTVHDKNIEKITG